MLQANITKEEFQATDRPICPAGARDKRGAAFADRSRRHERLAGKHWIPNTPKQRYGKTRSL